MASQCSVAYARWVPRFHSLMAAAAEAILAHREDKPADMESVKREATAAQRYYESLTFPKPPDPEIGRIAREGLILALKLKEFCDTLGLVEGDELFELCDDVVDHAEVVALSIDEDVIDAFRQSAERYRA